MTGMTVDAWNEMMRVFLDELCTTLDDVPSVQATRTAFSLAVAGDKEMVMKEYMRLMEPMASRVMARDETLVNDGSIGSTEVFKGCDFMMIWHEEMDDDTRGAICNYLQTLYSIGKTVEIIPAEVMGGIERVAQRMGEGMKGGEMGITDLNPSTIGQALAAELGADTEMGRTLADAAAALQDPNSEESKQAMMLQGMLSGMMNRQ